MAVCFAACFCLSGCSKDPLFDREQPTYAYHSDGRGIGIQPMRSLDGKLLSLIVWHQTTATINAADVGVVVPSYADFKIVSRAKLNFKQSGHAVTASELKMDDEPQSLADGPWIFYLTDHSRLRKIKIATSDLPQLDADLRLLAPFEFVDKWCLPAE